MGGGNGFAIGKNAAPEAVDFVKYLTAPEPDNVFAASGSESRWSRAVKPA